MQTQSSGNNDSLSLWYYFLPLALLWLILAFIVHYKCCVPKKMESMKHEMAQAQVANENDTSLKSDSPSVEQDSQSKIKPKQNDASTAALAMGAPFLVTLGAGDDIKLPVFSKSENFNFPDSDFVHTVPISDALNANLIKLRDFMGDNPSKRLNIVGKYTATEKNRTMFPDLGLARANDVKNYLLGLGFIAKQLNVSSKVDENPITDKGIVFSMADFNVEALSQAGLIAEKNKVAMLKERITAEPLVLQFDVGESEIGMTEKQRKKALNIVEYVDKTKGAVVKVTGHTDTLGTDENNYELGRDRAKFAAKFLTDNGLSESVIKIVSRGETQPIASNATLEGRTLNRRTVITVE